MANEDKAGRTYRCKDCSLYTIHLCQREDCPYKGSITALCRCHDHDTKSKAQLETHREAGEGRFPSHGGPFSIYSNDDGDYIPLTSTITNLEWSDADGWVEA